MLRKIESRLKLATVLLIFSGYLALITTFEYAEDVLLVPLAAVLLMPAGEWLDRRFIYYRKFTSAVTVAFVIADLASLRSGKPLDAVIALIMYIQVYGLLHQKKAREYIYLFLMAFFLILAATVMQPRPEIALVFMLFLFAMTWGMTLLEMFASGAVAAESTSAAPLQWRSAAGQILPAANIRLFGARLSLLIGVTIAGVLAIAVLVFVAGPRTEAGVIGARPSDAPIIGVSSEVLLSGGGVLQATATPVMRVQFPREPEGQYVRPMYWRVTAMDGYTGGSWQHRGLVTPGYRFGELSRLKSDSRRASIEGLERESNGWDEVYYEIYLDHPTETAVPLLDLVKAVTPGRENFSVQFRWDFANDFSVLAKTRNENGVYIQAWSEIVDPTPEQLRSAPTDYAHVMAREDFVQLTYQDLLPDTRDLVKRLTQNDRTAVEKILSLLHYLNSPRFEYSRTIPQLPVEHPIDAFINRERKGHCQLFASALALMVRSLGYPARIVTGYRGGTWDPSDKSYTITQDMAHVWVEVYFPTIGWVTFDPSPRESDPEFFTLSQISRTYSRYVLKARMIWLRNVVSFDSRRQGASMQAAIGKFFGFGANSWEAMNQDNVKHGLGNLARGSTVAVGFVATAAIALWLALRARDPKGPSRVRGLTADQKRAVRLHALVVRRLRRLGIRSPDATAEELADLAQHAHLTDSEVVDAALSLYNAARFGRRPLPPSDYQRWSRRVNQLRRVRPEPVPIRAG